VPDADTLLRIYLNDHLAGSALGLALARRARRSNPDGELGELLTWLIEEIDEDRSSLLRVMDAVDARPNPVKVGTARVAEVLGRLKLNGRVRGYSDLSRLLELEGLVLGIEGKRALWTALAASGRSLPVDLDELAARARRQQEAVDRLRLAAARRAVGTDA
jgi:hypothetical protein